ncbi:hypothetical protein D3C77_705370 [compost metagenome]
MLLPILYPALAKPPYLADLKAASPIVTAADVIGALALGLPVKNSNTSFSTRIASAIFSALYKLTGDSITCKPAC